MDSPLLSIVSFLSLSSYCFVIALPIFDIYEIYKTKQVDKYPYMIFIVFSITGYFWTVYGIKINAYTILLSSSFSMIMNMSYFIIFIISTSNTSKVKTIMISGYLLIFIILLIIEFIINPSAQVYGYISSTSSCLSVSSTIQKIREILKYRDISYIPFKLIFTYFLSCLIFCLLWYFNRLGFICDNTKSFRSIYKWISSVVIL